MSDTKIIVTAMAAKAIAWAWLGYTQYALPHDKLVFLPNPSGGDEDMHMGATAIDSIDTLILAGVDYSAAMHTVEVAGLETGKSYNFFECTIRILGGLLSAHALSGDKRLLSAAERVGSGLVTAFDTLPCSTIRDFKCKPETEISLAVAGTNILEFTQLSRATGNNMYELKATVAFEKLAFSAFENNCTLPSKIDKNGVPVRGLFFYGGGSDSYWEYLLKYWIFSGCKKTKYRILFDNVVSNFAAKRLRPSGHLDCFYPGALALSYLYGGPAKHLEYAEDLIADCMAFYDTPTGLGKDSRSGSTYALLRPEVMESLYYLFFVTKNDRYKNYADQIFTALEKHARHEKGGYCGVNLFSGKCPVWPGGSYRDYGSMPSFFVAETLKYYFLFSTTAYSPMTHVFTTEAHMMPIDLKTSVCVTRGHKSALKQEKRLRHQFGHFSNKSNQAFMVSHAKKYL